MEGRSMVSLCLSGKRLSPIVINRTHKGHSDGIDVKAFEDEMTRETEARSDEKNNGQGIPFRILDRKEM